MQERMRQITSAQLNPLYCRHLTVKTEKVNERDGKSDRGSERGRQNSLSVTLVNR